MGIFMTSNEFVEEFAKTYGSDYEYEWDEDSKQLILLCNIKADIDIGCIKITLEENSYDIYREFLYEDCYSHSMTLEILKGEVLFCECIKRITGKQPHVSYEDGMGCPFCCDLVGYFNLPLIWNDFAHMLAMIEQACHQMKVLTINEIDKNAELLSKYEETKFKTFETLKGISPDLCNKHIRDTPLNKNHDLDSVCAYVNTHNTVLIGVGLEHLPQVCDQVSNKQYYFYMGLQYLIICPEHEKDCITIANKGLVDQVIELFEQANEEWDIDSSIHYALDKRSWLIVTCGELWAIICPIKPEHHEACFTFEKNKIKSLERDFMMVAPENFWNRTFDFTKLSEKDFETMCRDLLVEMNFQNILVRGKPRAPDGGIDITADEEYETLIGTEKRKWIFQCKHMRGQIDRKDLSEVRDLLREFHADGYGLFYSGYFTPSTLDRMENISQNDKIKIRAWDFNALEILLTKFPKVSMKYFGL